MIQYDVCVCSLCYNEIDLLPAWYRRIKQFAKGLAILDTGSNDGSIEFIQHMKDRGEMDITLVVDPTDNFHGNFWREITRSIELSNKTWTLRFEPDMFPSPEFDVILPDLLKEKYIYYFYRKHIISLDPFLVYDRSFPRPFLFPTEWNMKFKPLGVHQGNVFEDHNHPIKTVSGFEIWHVGEARDCTHVRDKEVRYEKLGPTELTSKWNKELRQKRIDRCPHANVIHGTDRRILEMLI